MQCRVKMPVLHSNRNCNCTMFGFLTLISFLVLVFVFFVVNFHLVSFGRIGNSVANTN